MSATTKPRQDRLESVRQKVHSDCAICGDSGGTGFHATFVCGTDGVVRADVVCPAEVQGYTSIVHGGVICSLLDAAMTNCLFAHGVVGVTAELTVRFRHPVRTGERVTVEARCLRAAPPLYILEASLRQDGGVRAEAKGKFMGRPAGGPTQPGAAPHARAHAHRDEVECESM